MQLISYLKYLISCSLLVIPVLSQAQNLNPARPNVLVLYYDDLGYSDVGFNDLSQASLTPNLDQLANEGMNFTAGYSASSVCTPSRYTMMTGRYSWRTSLKSGVTGGYSSPVMSADRFTIGEMFQTQGYHTSMVGKWHIGMQFFSPNGSPVNLANNSNVLGTDINATSDDRIDFSIPLSNTPTTNGFDYFFGTSASLDMPPYAWIENETLLYRGGIVTGNGVDFSQARPATNADLLEGQPVDAVNRVRSGAYDPTFIVSDYLEIQAAKASSIIQERAETSDPFFMYVPFPAPHKPWSVAQNFDGSTGYPYGDYIAQTDHYSGVILDALEQSGLADNTIVIMSSDNGPELNGASASLRIGRDSNGSFRGVKRDNWEGGTRVPFTVRWPGRVEPGAVTAQAVSQVDLLATLSEVLGRELQGDEAPDSESFLAVLDGFDMPNARRSGLIQHSVSGQFSVVDEDGTWKLLDGTGGAGNRNNGGTYDADDLIIQNPDGVISGNPQQLFDLKSDSGERNNLLLSPDAAALSKQSELNAILDDIRGNTTNGANGDSNVPPFDLDGDGISNYFEDAFPELNANNASDAQDDDDQDGLNNLAEFAALTDPGNSDSDGDGVADGVEVARGTDPRVPESADNLALNQPTTQSTTDYGGQSSRAVDGNTNGNWRAGSITHTRRKNPPNPWWRVDLGARYDVSRINVFNRTNCCNTRLDGAQVYLGDIDSTNPADYTAVGSLTGTTSVQSLTPTNTTGRYVMVRIDGPGILSLAEVEVFGTPVLLENIALSQRATQSTTRAGGVASRAVDGNTDGFYRGNSVTHTAANSSNPWWRVDLGANYDISRITIFNRTGTCCSTRLHGATVYVGNINSTNPADYIALGSLTGNKQAQTMTGANTSGRYVMVRIEGTGTLSLAEVEVFGVSQ